MVASFSILYIEREHRDCLRFPNEEIARLGSRTEIEGASLRFYSQLKAVVNDRYEVPPLISVDLLSFSEDLRRVIFPDDHDYHKFESFLETAPGIIVVQSSVPDLMIPWEFLGSTLQDGTKDFLGKRFLFCRRSRSIEPPALPFTSPEAEIIGLVRLSDIPQALQINELFLNRFAQTNSHALETAMRALRILEQQAAGYTSLTIPTHLQIGMEDKRKEIAELERNQRRYEEPQFYNRESYTRDVFRLQKYIENLDVAHIACLFVSVKWLKKPMLVIDQIFAITAEDISGLRLLSRRPLVFFNPFNNGEYNPNLWIEFVSAFIEKGGRRVITSTYPLPDIVATEFAKEYYRGMTSADSVDELEALQITKQSLLAKTNNPMVLAYMACEPVPSTPYSSPVSTVSASKTITWLHISDLHFRKSEYDADVVLEALVGDVQTQGNGEHKLRPDFILVSGDVAHSGGRKEYERAAQFFERLISATSVSRERVFIVPGNHDVDWTAFDDVLSVGYSQKLIALNAIDECLGSLRERQRIFKKFRYYRNFINTNFPSILCSARDYYFVETMEIGGKRLSVLGLNSAWMSAYRRRSDGRPDDRHSLILGRKQLRDAVKVAKEGKPDIIIALMHHPTEWFDDELDRREIEGVLKSECDFVLHGHLHDNTVLAQWSPGSAIYTIGAGASFAYDDGSHRDYYGYNFTRLDLSTGVGRVYLRSYSRKGEGFWTEDVNSYQGAKNGICTFELKDSWLR